MRALLLLGALGKAMGPAVERAARQCLAPALNCLADKKKPVRVCHKTIMICSTACASYVALKHWYGFVTQQCDCLLMEARRWPATISPTLDCCQAFNVSRYLLASGNRCQLHPCTGQLQVRDAVVTMLDDWVGDRGRVPLERLAPAVQEVTVAPKMSPEGRIAAISWLGGALASEQVRSGCGLGGCWCSPCREAPDACAAGSGHSHVGVTCVVASGF